MPILNLTLMEGYDSQTKKDLSSRLTRAVLETIDAPPEAVIVVINEVPTDHYMRGGIRRAPGAAKS
ncbi:MAG: 4-oxalocrotonate tautomerase family protein [Pseudomonadota bacterium]